VEIMPARSWGKRHDPLSSLRVAEAVPATKVGNNRCPFPSEVFEHLERLVGEVDGVATVEEDMVGDSGEHDVGDRGRIDGGDGRRQRSLGGIG
jgi:hypothetical protein